MIPGDKVWKTDASLLAGGLAKLGPAKNMSKKPFLLKNERITGAHSAEQSGIIKKTELQGTQGI